jgi:CheY-like chemotaxis protein
MDSERTLAGTYVLFLEDDAIISMSMRQILEEMGCTVRAFLHLPACFDAICRERFDIAILDVKIGSQTSYALAERLDAEGVPIVFVSGYDSPAMQKRWAKHPTCRKPCLPSRLKAAILSALSG